MFDIVGGHHSPCISKSLIMSSCHAGFAVQHTFPTLPAPLMKLRKQWWHFTVRDHNCKMGKRSLIWAVDGAHFPSTSQSIIPTAKSHLFLTLRHKGHSLQKNAGQWSCGLLLC
jgi:hypothetical protein